MFDFFKAGERLLIRLHEGNQIPDIYVHREEESYDPGGSGDFRSFRPAIDCQYSGNTPEGIMVKPFIGGNVHPEQELVQIKWQYIRTIKKKY